MAQKPDVASNEKNEYIPAFITKKPFWVPDDDSAPSSDYLEHQRLQKEEEQSRWYDRGKKKGPAATKYRKGACENCGAMTHKTKECLSRPRAKGAKWTGRNIQADEVIQDVKMGWDAKRDRWNGYDASEYMNVVKDFEELEKMKKAVRDEQSESALAKDDVPADEGARYAEESDMGREQNTATRSLRLREDTAKYLLNLDLESAKYDPKTRSMVDSGATADAAAALVAEDNFMRASGDAAEFEKAQKFAWESQERGDANKIHLQANPTAGEHVRKKQLEEASAKREAQRRYLTDLYGGSEHEKSDLLKGTAVIESERFVEYDSSGAVKGLQNSSGKSKYAENVLINNHTSVWGSWWKEFSWGYACCHSTVKNSYCTGETGKEANQRAEQMRLDEGGPAFAEEEEPATSDERSGARKRTAAELKAEAIDAETEAYKRSRMQADDPMRKMIGKDELLNE